MGVITCDVYGCENIMCDRRGYAPSYGMGTLDICDEHFEQLVILGPGTDLESFFEGDIQSIPDPNASRAFFDEMFPSGRDDRLAGRI